MNKSFIFTFIMTVVGAIIGAGFASGKEVITFFGEFGFWSIPFLLLIGALFFWCFFMFSKLGKIVRPQSISDINKAVFKKGYIAFDIVIVLCSFITLASMLAGSDGIGNTLFGAEYNFPFISIITAMLAVLIVIVGIRYIFKMSNILLPIIIGFILVVVVGFYIFAPKDLAVVSEGLNFNGFAFILSSILYVSMNTFGNSFLIAKTSTYMNKKQIKTASIISSCLVLGLVVLILISIFLGGTGVLNAELPMVAIALSYSGVLGTIYSVILWLAIFTTIVVTAYTLQTWLNNYIKNKFLCAVIVVIIGFAFSRFGFSTIVSVFYPLEGVFGLVYIICCSVYYFKHKNDKLINDILIPQDENEICDITPKSLEEVNEEKLETKIDDLTIHKLKYDANATLKQTDNVLKIDSGKMKSKNKGNTEN